MMRMGGGGARRDSTDPGGHRAPDSLRTKRTVIWILDPQGKPEPVPVQIGLSDGATTQIISEKIKQGDVVIVGQEGVQATADNQQVNPFMPRFGGGGGRR